MEILTAHQVEKHEPVSKFRPDVPPELEAIIDKMTAKLPLQRFQSAKEVAEKLRAWLHESESGRTSYSRISALMAEAARAKQSSANGTVPATGKAKEPPAEFEFANLDDAPVGLVERRFDEERQTCRGEGRARHGGGQGPQSSQRGTEGGSPGGEEAADEDGQVTFGTAAAGRFDLGIAAPWSPAPRFRIASAHGPVAAEGDQAPRVAQIAVDVGGRGRSGDACAVAASGLFAHFLIAGTNRRGSRAVGTIGARRGADVQRFASATPAAGAASSFTNGGQSACPASHDPAPSHSCRRHGQAPPSPPSPGEPSVERLLAGLTEIDVGTSLKSINPSLVRFYTPVGSAALAAVGQLGLRVTDKAPAELAVDMQADETSASPNVRLLLELTYRLPDGKHITLWKGTNRSWRRICRRSTR